MSQPFYPLLTLTTAITLVILPCSFAAEPTAEKQAGTAKAKITIGKDTTYITEPLRPDGYPDYIAALNQRMSQGVTVENNAAVLLAKVFGPGILEEDIRAETYKQLGIEPLPEDGDYLVSYHDFLKQWKTGRPADAAKIDEAGIGQQFVSAQEKPWTREQFPLVAEWLARNEKPLKLAAEAIQRPRHFWPYVLPKDDEFAGRLFGVNLAHAQETREIASLLVTRAMYRTGQGDLRGAWEDNMRCHRLARLIGQGAFLVELLVGTALEGYGTFADVSYAHYGKLSAEQIKTCRESIAQLGPVARVADKVALGERFVLMDSTIHMARDGHYNAIIELINLIESLSSNKKQKPKKPLGTGVNFRLSIDWDIPATMVNEWFDRLATVESISDSRERAAAHVKFDEDIKQVALSIKRGPKEYAAQFFGDSARGGTTVGRIMVSLFLPATAAAGRAIDRTQVEREMLQVVFALTAYRNGEGKYPASIDELIPKYLAKIPDDVFRREPGPIRYRREGDGYILWSVHVNGIDEDGASYEDDPKGDDWVLRPVPREKK